MVSAEMKCYDYIEKKTVRAAVGNIRSLCRASIFGASVVYLYNNIQRILFQVIALHLTFLVLPFSVP